MPLTRQPTRSFETLEQRVQFDAAPLFAHTTATLSQARVGSAATSVADRALFAGGVSGGVDFRTVDVYDARTATWSVANLSKGRHGLAAVTAAGRALFAGGLTTSNGRKTDVVDIFDADSGRWSTTTMPHPRSYLGAASVGRVAIFAGNNVTPSDTADAYDGVTGRWSTAKLPASINFNAAATTAGRLAIFASGSATKVDRTFADIYDADTGKWSASRLPGQVFKPRHAASVGTKAFFADDPTDGFLYSVYDSITGTWSSHALSLRPRSDPVIASVGSKVLFAGGLQGNVGLDVVDVYDTASGQWSTLTLSQGRALMAATSVGKRVIFAGGVTGSLAASAAVDIFTDLTPAPVLSGGIAGDPATGRVTVTLLNTGDASLPPGGTLRLYATAVRGVVGSSSRLLASVKLAKTLRAGGSATITLDVSAAAAAAAADLLPGSYHLLASVATSKRHVTPVAATADTFAAKSREQAPPHGLPFARGA